MKSKKKLWGKNRKKKTQIKKRADLKKKRANLEKGALDKKGEELKKGVLRKKGELKKIDQWARRQFNERARRRKDFSWSQEKISSIPNSKG